MTDVAQFLDPKTMAEPKAVVEARQAGYEEGYRAGIRNGVALGIGATIVVLIALDILGRLVR
jgi:hypothetical protein